MTLVSMEHKYLWKGQIFVNHIQISPHGAKSIYSNVKIKFGAYTIAAGGPGTYLHPTDLLPTGWDLNPGLQISS